MSPRWQQVTGAGPWAWRTALTLAVLLISATALGGLLQASVARHYALGVVALVATGAALARRTPFDTYGLSAVALGIDVLLIAGLARWLLDTTSTGRLIGPLLVLGSSAAGLLAASVWLVLRLARPSGRRVDEP